MTAEYPDATIVSGEYNSPSTKDMTHKRRAKSLKTIHFNNDMKFGGDMKVFLSNNKNKQIHTYPWGKVVITWLSGDLL